MSDQSVLEELRDRRVYAATEWQEIQQEARKDMRYVAGNPWDDGERKAREDAGRVVLSLDELHQYYNQVVNDVRANPRAMRFSPTGNGANDKGAELYADKARETEYRSHAQVGYTTAFENTIERSYGWVRLSTRFASETKGFDQDIWIDAVPNPDTVLADPDAQQPDSSDAKYLFNFESRTVKEFVREFPDARIKDFTPTVIAQAPTWIKAGRLQIAEYWTKEPGAERELLLVKLPGDPVPIEVFRHDLKHGLPSGATVIKSRKIRDTKVLQYLTNGVEILRKTAWAGKYIPFASCFGKVLYVDEGGGAKRKILSMTRLARDPFMLYCYYRTQQAEMAGMIPKVPVMGYKGQFRNVENSWAKANHEPVAFLEANAITEATGATILPLPVRLAYEAGAHLQALELCAEGARRAIQSAMGSSPLPTQAQRHNEKSGVALAHMEDSAQRGSFHFVDHYDTMIRHVGVMFEDLCPHVYDTMREVGIRKADDKAALITINNPQGVDEAGKPDENSTKGDYLVTVSSGPAADSQRDAVSDFVGKLASIPEVMQLAGDLIVRIQGRTMNLGPLIDELADRLTPPPFKQPKEGEGPDPAQMQQMMAAAKEENDKLKALLGEAIQKLQTEQVKADADFKLQTALQVMKNAATIEVAKINARAKQVLSEGEAHDEAVALHEEQAHEVGMAAMAQDHALESADAQAQATAAQTEQQQAGASDLAAQSHQQALEQQAAQPQPEAGA